MFFVSDVTRVLMDVYPLPSHMTDRQTVMHFHKLGDDGETLLNIGACVHNREDDIWTVRIHRKQRDLLICERDVTKADIYSYLLREAKLLASVMENNPDKYKNQP